MAFSAGAGSFVANDGSVIVSVQSDYIKHLKKTDPFLYAVSKRAYEIKHGKTDQLSGIMDFDFNDFLKTVSEAAPKIAQSVATVKISQANVARAKAGQAPLDVESYVQTNPNYDPNNPDTMRAVNIAANRVARSTQNNLVPALILGGSLIAFMVFRKK